MTFSQQALECIPSFGQTPVANAVSEFVGFLQPALVYFASFGKPETEESRKGTRESSRQATQERRQTLGCIPSFGLTPVANAVSEFVGSLQLALAYCVLFGKSETAERSQETQERREES